MDISIIIPVYNVEQYVQECIESVIAQKNIDDIEIECLVVDDCGSDKSMDIVTKAISTYQGRINFHIITRKTNGGLSAARNSGIEKASGKYLYFLDSDDYISEVCISTLWGYVKKYPDVNIVYGRTVCVPDSTHMDGYFDFRLKGGEYYSSDVSKIRATHFDFPATAWNKLINTSWVKKNGLMFLEGVYHEDEHWHMAAYGCIHSYACALDEFPTYMYRQREGSIINQSTLKKRQAAFYEIYLDLSKKILFWDRRICRKYCDMLLWLKGMPDENAKTKFNSLLSFVLENRNLSMRARLLFRYFRLPVSAIKGKIAYLILDCIVR
ncbi:MAG: glycosyltransferase [Muribaculaceae bacterium]|nr:glycosyltransferase [Muribaculaceae bacterium]